MGGCKEKLTARNMIKNDGKGKSVTRNRLKADGTKHDKKKGGTALQVLEQSSARGSVVRLCEGTAGGTE